jgi:hypothetical protein
MRIVGLAKRIGKAAAIHFPTTRSACLFRNFQIPLSGFRNCTATGQ